MGLHSTMLVATGLATVVIGAYACGGSASAPTPTLPPTPEPTTAPTPVPLTVAEVLERAGTVMETLESFEFLIGHESGATPLMPNLNLEEASGQVIRPDKITTDFSGTFGGYAFKSSLVSLGDTTYMTNPLTGLWEEVPTELNPYQFFNPQAGIAAMMSQVVEARMVQKGGVYRITGMLPAQALGPLLGTTVEDSLISVEIEIDAEFRIVEAVLDGRATPNEPDGTVRVIRLSQFNEPFEIQPPT